jgi:NAD(P)-dependent dehydrogenase (short-subunit alcohol dehydrogenase family)
MNQPLSGTTASAARTVVITGGNTGLGFACADAILQSPGGTPWHIVLACRDKIRAWEAVDQLASGAGMPGQVEAMSLDLASLPSIRAFTTELGQRLDLGALPPLHAVVCNAGVNPGPTNTVTADGFESSFGVNHLGHFRLVYDLLPALQAPARVVVVASGVHDPAQKSGVPAPAWNNPEALAHGNLGPAAESDSTFVSGQRRYSTSKLANIYFTYALARRLPKGITANAFDPGFMPGTGLMREAPAPFRFVAKRILPRALPLLRRVYSPNVHTAQESGTALARLVTDPALAATTGEYFEGLQPIRSSDESYNEQRAEELWIASTLLTSETATR